MGREWETKPAPGFVAHPDYQLFFEDRWGLVRAYVGDEAIAESDRCLILYEGVCRPTTFFPRDDVDMARFTRAEHAVYCPYKGVACFWDIHLGARWLRRSAWSYESPFDEVRELAGYVAFDSHRVEVRLDEPRPVSWFPPSA